MIGRSLSEDVGSFQVNMITNSYRGLTLMPLGGVADGTGGLLPSPAPGAEVEYAEGRAGRSRRARPRWGREPTGPAHHAHHPAGAATRRAVCAAEWRPAHTRRGRPGPLLPGGDRPC